jgi:NAD-dependent SIR2 family protein deacetylase
MTVFMARFWHGKIYEDHAIYFGDGELNRMKCPECGKEVKKPIKEWELSPKVHVKLYECCGKKFREYVRK